MKIVSDFDGVMTHLVEEGHRVQEIFQAALETHCGGPFGDILRKVDDAMLREPTRHGWRMKGRVTAFANEDLFIHHNGRGACLDDFAEAGLHHLGEHLKSVKKAGFESFSALASHSYNAMVEETRKAAHKPIDPSARSVIEAILKAGHELVIVSNSGTQRILDILAGGGITAADHEKDPQAQFRVRGNAQKFGLGDNSRVFPVGGYAVEVDRPFYEKILRDERPGAVIGDVFSLDLTLPLELAHREPETFGGIRLFLLKQEYTPGWSQDFIRLFRNPVAKPMVLPALKELPVKLG